LRITRYNDCTIGKMISMRCRRSPSNRDVIVIDNEKLEQVYVYDYTTLDDVLGFLQDVMNIDIVPVRQPPIRMKLVNHEAAGYVYQIAHEDDHQRDDFHAFFTPQEEPAA